MREEEQQDAVPEGFGAGAEMGDRACGEGEVEVAEFGGVGWADALEEPEGRGGAGEGEGVGAVEGCGCGVEEGRVAGEGEEDACVGVVFSFAGFLVGDSEGAVVVVGADAVVADEEEAEDVVNYLWGAGWEVEGVGR